MLRKPWPIIFTSIIFFAIPIFNIVFTYFILKTEYGFSDYLYSLVTIKKNSIHTFDMLLPSMFAGFAIYSVKKWSYPTFLLCMAWITIRVIYDFPPDLTMSNLFFVILLPMSINILFVSYILLPEVRAAYYDPRLRWWETKPRYIISADLEIISNEQIVQAKLTNISEGGLFAIIPTPIAPETQVILKFCILDLAAELKAKIVYSKNDGISHGIQFINLEKKQKKLLKNIIARLIQDKYDETRPVPIWTEDLSKWLQTLIKTGTGLIPDLGKFSPPGKDQK